jgi:5'-deoxynucleotidase
MMNVVKVFSTSQKMASIRRYSSIHLLKEESVLEHTGFVCMFTYLVCLELNAFNTYVDLGKALSRAVVHDVDEVVTGDIPRPTKYFDSDSIKIFKKISEVGISSLIKEMDASDNVQMKLREDWENSKKDNEGMVVALADLASVVYKLWDEVILLGNKKMMMQCSDVDDYISDYLKLLKSSKFDREQVKVIERICSDLKIICDKIMKEESPFHGTFSSNLRKEVNYEHLLS